MDRFTSFDGTELAYSDVGVGTPILCLAGLTRNSDDFRYVAPHLTGRRMIALDYRGRGQSEWAHEDTYTVPTEARDALALLDHLGLEKAAVVGTSRGGLIAMGLGLGAKDRLLGVVLNDIGPVIEAEGLDVIKDYLGQPPAWTTLDDAAGALSRSPGFVKVPRGRWRQEAENRYLELPTGLALRHDPRLRNAVLARGAQPAPDLWPFFDALADLPLALIRGQNSNLLSEATADEMQARAPGMIRADIPDRGHVPFLDEPDATQAIADWLECLP